MSEHSKLKAQLTRAIKSGSVERVEAACRHAVTVWNTHPDYAPGWPDDWGNWQRALDDVRMNHYPFIPGSRLEDL